VQRATVPDTGWPPRLAQEARLAELDALIGSQPFDHGIADLAIERAALLGALNRQDDAKQAFVDILHQAPTHFSALNEFGALLTSIGAISAACRVYAEAILHHPDNPMAQINLANLLFRASRYDEARRHYEAALQADPDNVQAHQGLGAVLSDLGEHAAARVHFDRGFRGHAISTLPYRGNKPPIPLLQLVSSGGGNIPAAVFLDDTVFQTSVIVADYLEPSAPLPPHRLIFNAIGDADLCMPALQAAMALTERTGAPLLNDPRAVMATGRIANARRLGSIKGVVTPLTLAIRRDVLAGPDGIAMIQNSGFDFPLLLRSPGYHTGRNFLLVATADDLALAASGLPGDELIVIAYLDARGRDGKARKYRVMMIGGNLYPLHLAISPNWKVHYFTSEMAENAEHRREEAKFLEDMPGAIGDRAVAALEQISKTLGLDYAGVDFGLDGDGDLLLFEANATMVINRPDDDSRWTYRRNAIERAIDATVELIRSKSEE
jgi:Flp pilus assembly protein TadD/glutathione synthase/RimK-type ligase-like ATP-grasp enzyme